jgi:hypothetical protein
VLVVTGQREVMELAGVEGWWRRLLELIAASTGVGSRGFGSADQHGMEWWCSRGHYIGQSQGEEAVAVGARARPMAVNGAILSGGGNGRGKREPVR